MLRARLLLALLGAWLVAVPAAHAYEFEVKARTIGQGYTLQSLRFMTGDLALSRRRFTQTLQLHVWDIGGRRVKRSLFDPEPEKGPHYYVSSYMRLDHDYGDYTDGKLVIDGRLFDVVDLIPELGRSSLQLDVLYAYAAAEGLAGGALSLYLGRQLEIDTLDWFSMDGVKARVELPLPLAVEAFVGLRVRDSSLLGSDLQEPDGTASALCEEYVEGSVPGSGAWRPIDRDLLGTNNPFRSDFEICPQRQEWMPTGGFAVETRNLPWLHARLAYRRSQSRTPGLIGAVDRFDFPDVGLYPNELGQAPTWGVNEERLSVSARAPLKLGAARDLLLTPYAALRYSVLHGVIDEAHAGTRYQRGVHGLEGEVFYSFPTFDGDSIFNVFSVEPYYDARVTYELAPRESPWRLYGRAWGRRYSTEDATTAMAGSGVVEHEYAAGAQTGARYLEPSRHMVRADAFHEDGYGGRRSGGFLSARLRLARDLELATRLSVIRFREDQRADLRATTLGAQLGSTYEIVQGVAATLLIEENSSRIDRHQLAVFAMLDLAFQPET